MTTKSFRVVEDVETGEALAGECTTFTKLADALLGFQGKFSGLVRGTTVEAADHVMAVEVAKALPACAQGSVREFERP